MLEHGQHVCKALLWNYLKLKIKDYSIEFSIKQLRNKKHKAKELESFLDSLDKDLIEQKDDSIIQTRREN